MLIGLDTGTTANFAIVVLGWRVAAGLKVTTVARSLASSRTGEEVGLPVLPFDTLKRLVLAIDGADGLDPQLRAIKGRGGAILREKVVAATADRMIVIIDDSKQVPRLGRGTVPVEVLPFAAAFVSDRIERLGATVSRRGESSPRGRLRKPLTGAQDGEWREGDAVNLGLPDQTFDLVLCQQGLQFFSDRALALRETRRALTGYGRAVFSVWRDLGLHPVYKALFEATARHLAANVPDFDVSFSLDDADELKELLRGAGFKRLETTPRSLHVRLLFPERFVQLTIAGAATSVPAFMRMIPEARAKLIEAIDLDVQSAIRSYTDGGELVFPMSTHIAVGT